MFSRGASAVLGLHIVESEAIVIVRSPQMIRIGAPFHFE
jgi:hypothetical protein